MADDIHPPPSRRDIYEGCCRAAVDSEGFAHDHFEWHAEVIRLRRKLEDAELVEANLRTAIHTLTAQVTEAVRAVDAATAGITAVPRSCDHLTCH